MSEQKGLGSKLLGIFVESDGSKATDVPEPSVEKSAAELIAEIAGQTTPGKPTAKRAASSVPAASPDPLPHLKLGPLAASATGPIDFDAVFREAGMDVAELDRVNKAQELLKSLPEETPQPVKKQIVEASLKAFGFEIAKIAQAAQNQRRALDAYVKVNENATAKAITDAEAQIRSLNEKIAGLRTDIEKRTSGLAALSISTQTRKGEVQKVIEFFQAAAAAAQTKP